jgi:hypothetical protein
MNFADELLAVAADRELRRLDEKREGRAMGVAPPSARVSKPTGFERTVTLQIR